MNKTDFRLYQTSAQLANERALLAIAQEEFNKQNGEIRLDLKAQIARIGDLIVWSRNEDNNVRDHVTVSLIECVQHANRNRHTNREIIKFLAESCRYHKQNIRTLQAEFTSIQKISAAQYEQTSMGD